MGVREFRRCNNLKQAELAEYLGVTEGYISRVENGFTKLSEEKMQMLLKSQNGWDLTLLDDGVNNSNAIAIGAGANAESRVNICKGDTGKETVSMLKEKIAVLEKALEEEKARSAQYWAMIQDLIKK